MGHLPNANYQYGLSKKQMFPKGPSQDPPHKLKSQFPEQKKKNVRVKEEPLKQAQLLMLKMETCLKIHSSLFCDIPLPPPPPPRAGGGGLKQ